MGNTKFQRMVFTLLMCFFMVLGMTIYNIILHSGFGVHIFSSLVKELWLVFIVALVLDVFIVGPFAKSFVFKVIKPQSKITTILSIGSSMVICMVTLMSIFGSVMSQGFTADAFANYPVTWLRNFVVALPFNLLFVSPVSRGIFSVIFSNNNQDKNERATA